jgi:glucose-6-phosphate 1-dehydrogenase
MASDTPLGGRHGRAPSCAMVIFGASGDLAKRLLIPAIYNLSKAGRLPENFALIGVDRAQFTDDSFRETLTEGVRHFVADPHGGGAAGALDEDAWGFIAARLKHVQGDATEPECYRAIGRVLEQVEAEFGTGGNAIFYLAVGAFLFRQIVTRLAEAGLTEEKDGRWRRLIVEKPFGTDLASAKALNAHILSLLKEPQIYRMDHFLGKETVQNIMVLRFANGIFEPLWNRDHIDHVQITVAETVGVEHRAAFYEQTGALRDMVPNHVFQLLALTAMEPPNSFGADAVRTEKDKVLEAIEPLSIDDVQRNVVRGQYTAGRVLDRAVKDYRDEEGVAKDSMTQTYVAMQLAIDNWRWADVPFYLRTGKSLSRRTTEIAIQFKRVPFALFRDTPVDTLTPNVLVLRLQPDEGISMQIGAKRPGPEIELGAVTMDFRYKDFFQSAPATGYETLVYDCMIGDAMLFQRADSVEAGWAVVQPIMDYWANDKMAPLEFYTAGSEGPDAAEQLLWRSGRAWRSIG